jgi:hypothetical protein
MRHVADDFTSPPKGLMLLIFIALESLSSSAEFEPSKSDGKNANL